MRFILNIIWLVLCGFIIAAILLAITIIGIPLALGNLKLVPISLTPFGRTVVPVAQAEAAGGPAF